MMCTKFLLGVVSTVVTCADAEDIVNAERVGSGNEYSDEHTYSCRPDDGVTLLPGQVLRHDDGSVNKTITCQQNGNWSAQDLSCDGSGCF